jgi:hypothetical protein
MIAALHPVLLMTERGSNKSAMVWFFRIFMNVRLKIFACGAHRHQRDFTFILKCFDYFDQRQG